MPKVGKIKAEFLVNGQVVQEYRDEDPEQSSVANRASIYVEVVDGATFEICCTVDDDYEFAPAIDLTYKLKLTAILSLPTDRCRRITARRVSALSTSPRTPCYPNV